LKLYGLVSVGHWMMFSSFLFVANLLDFRMKCLMRIIFAVTRIYEFENGEKHAIKASARVKHVLGRTLI